MVVDVRSVLHIGPHPMTVGGTQSVIRTFADFSIGAERVTVVPTWDGKKLVGNSRLVLRAARIIAASDRDTVVHIHLTNAGAYARDGPLAAFARRRGMKVIMTVHGHDFPEYARRRSVLVRAVVSQAHHVICLSDEACAAARVVLGHNNVTRLPNPVAIDLESPPAGDTPPVVLFAGAICLRKGADVLVEAWRRLLARGVEGECHLVGPIEDFSPPSMERLSIAPAVSPRLVRPLLRAARVIVLPSRAEALPMILTEALAAARPFVATPVGGTRELAPCDGMIVPVDDPDALADAIARFLQDRALAQRTGDEARRFCIATRSPEVIDVQLRALYAGAGC